MYRIMGTSNAIRVVLIALCFSLPASYALNADLHERTPTPDPMAGLPPDSSRLEAIQLGEGDEPSISPDGRRIAYVWGPTICLYELDTGTTHQVCRNHNPHGVTWNPSGTKLAFQGDDSVVAHGKFWIWFVNPNGSDLRRISEGPEDEHPLWSPDGKHLVWSRARRLWQADSSGSDGHFLTRQPPPYVREYARAWTEDGLHLLFMRGSEMGEEFRLWQVGRDTTDEAPDLTTTPVSRSQLGVTQDGRLLYRRAGTSSTNEIEFLERGANGRARRCYVTNSDVYLISLAPDRSFAVFTYGDEEDGEILWLLRWRPEGGR